MMRFYAIFFPSDSVFGRAMVVGNDNNKVASQWTEPQEWNSAS